MTSGRRSTRSSPHGQWRRAHVLRALDALDGDDRALNLGNDDYAWAKVAENVPDITVAIVTTSRASEQQASLHFVGRSWRAQMASGNRGVSPVSSQAWSLSSALSSRSSMKR